jgi:ribosomal 30S subunit maturation factor RimM
VTLPAGQYFVADLVGCAVFEAKQETPALTSSPCAMDSVPQFVGNVRDVQFPGEGERLRGTPVLEVDTAQGELLIPLATDICRHIDTAARRIEVVFPEGLRELNVE